MSDTDRRIGANLQALRGSTSQSALAAQMKDRGWRWSQPTVAAIEKGERALKLAEAEHLVEILGLDDLEELIARPFRARADSAWNRMVNAADAIRLASLDFWDAQRHMAAVADEENGEGSDEDRQIWELWLTSDHADPAFIVGTVAPFIPLRPETFDRIPSLAADHPWTRRLAFGPYGAHSARSRERDGSPADAAQ